jgi:hypothetical protein
LCSSAGGGGDLSKMAFFRGLCGLSTLVTFAASRGSETEQAWSFGYFQSSSPPTMIELSVSSTIAPGPYVVIS